MDTIYQLAQAKAGSPGSNSVLPLNPRTYRDETMLLVQGDRPDTGQPFADILVMDAKEFLFKSWVAMSILSDLRMESNSVGSTSHDFLRVSECELVFPPLLFWSVFHRTLLTILLNSASLKFQFTHSPPPPPQKLIDKLSAAFYEIQDNPIKQLSY